MSVARMATKEECRQSRRERSRASQTVRVALAAGILIKPDACERCGRGNCRINGHHADYSQPLVVEWLCSKCHRVADQERREREESALRMPRFTTPPLRITQLLSTKEVAARLQLSPKTLDNWRYLGKGPPWFLINRTVVRYETLAVEEWVLKRREGLTPETLEEARLAELEKEAR